MYRQIRLRVENLGLHIPGQIIRLDLYRLICHFHSSEYLSKLSDGLDFCPWQELRDEFQNSEIIRILLQTAVMVRFIGFGHADETRSEREALEVEVGSLLKRGNQTASEPLPLREACNKLVHARNIVLDSNDDGNPYRHFIKPRVFCYEDFQKQTGWKAELDVLLFVEVCSSLAALFA